MVDAPPSKTLARGLDVLDMVLHADPPMRLTDVAERMQMDMASAHRMLRTLEVRGYLTRGESERGYRPGKKIWSLAHCLPKLHETLERLRPLLLQLTEDTGQVAHIGTLEMGRVVLADVVLTPSARVSVTQATGDTEDVYCSAIGKVLAAFAPRDKLDDILEAQDFKRHTQYTIVGREALEIELERVRRCGHAFDDREGSLDVSCISAPILDPSGMCEIAIGISTIASQLTGSICDRADWISLVRDAAILAEKQIS